MSKVLVTEQYLTDIADAIRQKKSVVTTYKPSEMAAAVESIETGITPSGTKNITVNGTHDVTDYATAEVAVPNSYAAGDEGKVVSNGALVAQTSRRVTDNGTYDTTTNNELIVDVGDNVSRLYIINPEVLSACYNNGNYNQYPWFGTWMYPYIGYNPDSVNNNYRYPVIATRAYNGITKPCIYRNGFNTGTYNFPAVKIPGGKYSKLCMQVEVNSGFASSWKNVYIVLTPDIKPTGAGTWNTILKKVWLANSSWNAEQIVAQEGVTITCTTAGVIPAQLVEIDIQDVSEDCYFGIFDCDRSYYLWSVYVE